MKARLCEKCNIFCCVPTRWMDGSPVVYQRWDENQPNFLNNDENCVVMTTSMGE